MSAMISPGSSGGPPASGSIPWANSRTQPIASSRTAAFVPIVRSRPTVRSRSAPGLRCGPAVTRRLAAASGRQCKAGSRRTRPRRIRTSIRWATREPMLAPTNTPSAVGAGDERVDHAAREVDDRAGRRGDADHQVARRGRDPQRDAHHEVHDRHLDDPAADPQQRRDDARARRSPKAPAGTRCHAVGRAGQARVEELGPSPRLLVVDDRLLLGAAPPARPRRSIVMLV